MKTHYRIIFDLDSTINNLNEYVYKEIVRFPFERINSYNISKNGLSPEQVNTVLAAYNNPSTFAKLSPVHGAEKMRFLIKNPFVKVYVHSLSTRKEINGIKMKWIKELYPYFDEDKILLVCGEEKKMLDDVYVQVEDCLENLMRSTAKHKILINKPYNQCQTLPDNIYRVESLSEAFDLIEVFLKNI